MNNKSEIKLDYDHHRDQEVVLIGFDYNLIFEKDNNIFIAPNFGYRRTLFKMDI